MWSLLPIAISCLFLSASSLLSNGADYREIETSEKYHDHERDNATIETSGRILGNFYGYKDVFNRVRNSTRSLRPLSYLRDRNVNKSHLTTTQHPMNLKHREDD